MKIFTVRVVGTAPVWADIEIAAETAEEAYEKVAAGDSGIDIPYLPDWQLCEMGNGVDDWEVSGDVFEADEAVMEDGKLIAKENTDEDES